LVVAQCHGGLANITLTRLTIEAELTALDTTNTEVEWMHELLIDLSVVQKPIPTILTNCENQTVILSR
jgi:hypothetical protein